MTLELAKKLIHHIANQLQAVLGYLELERYDKAKKSLKEAFTQLRQLANALAALHKTAREIEEQAARASADANAALKQVSIAKKAADEVAVKAAEVKAQLADVTKLPAKKKGPRLL